MSVEDRVAKSKIGLPGIKWNLSSTKYACKGVVLVFPSSNENSSRANENCFIDLKLLNLLNQKLTNQNLFFITFSKNMSHIII